MWICYEERERIITVWVEREGYKWFSVRIVHGWTTNGCNVWKEEYRFNKCTDEREVDYQRWVGSVLSASRWNMKGVRCERKKYRCKGMWANERKVDYQHMGKTGRLTKGTATLCWKLVKDKRVLRVESGLFLSNCYQRIDRTGTFTTGSTEYMWFRYRCRRTGEWQPAWSTLVNGCGWGSEVRVLEVERRILR